MFKKYTRIDVFLFLLCVVFFTTYPELDILVSSLFYSAEAGKFVWRYAAVNSFVYEYTNYLAYILTFSLLGLVVAAYGSKIQVLTKKKKVIMFLFLTLVAGPGFVVNTVFKDNWDRPRPREVIEFGGSFKFEPPLSPTFECEDCYSFVSGHASVGFYFFAVALLLRKRRWLLLPVLMGGGIGFVRIMQGGHFLSDVIFSGWVVWFVSVVMYSLFFPSEHETEVSLTK